MKLLASNESQNQNNSISVLMATFNGERFIKEQIKSILSQTEKPKELIIIDDHSNDSTLHVALKALNNSGINWKVYTRKKNIGYAKNFIDGVRYCSGEYVAFCDQDDIWHPDKIRLASGLINSNRPELIFSNYVAVDSTAQKIISKFTYNNTTDNLHRSLLSNPIIPGMTMICKTEWLNMNLELLLNTLQNHPSIPHDYLLSLGVSKSAKVQHLKYDLVFYRQHESNTIGLKRRKKYSYSDILFVEKQMKDLNDKILLLNFSKSCTWKVRNLVNESIDSAFLEFLELRKSRRIQLRNFLKPKNQFDSLKKSLKDLRVFARIKIYKALRAIQ